jgi:hypothetical protein
MRGSERDTYDVFDFDSGLAMGEEQVETCSANDDYEDGGRGLLVLCLCGEGEEFVHCGFGEDVLHRRGCVYVK